MPHNEQMGCFLSDYKSFLEDQVSGWVRTGPRGCGSIFGWKSTFSVSESFVSNTGDLKGPMALLIRDDIGRKCYGHKPSMSQSERP